MMQINILKAHIAWLESRVAALEAGASPATHAAAPAAHAPMRAPPAMHSIPRVAPDAPPPNSRKRGPRNGGPYYAGTVMHVQGPATAL
jgi:hypothetical protein